MLVVCRHDALASRLHQHLAADTFDLEFVDSSDYPARVVNGVETDFIVLDVSAAAPMGFDVYRVLQPRSAAPPLLVLRARPGENDSGLRWSSGGIEALEWRLHCALGRTSDRFTWLPVDYAGRFLTASLPGTTVTVDGRAVAVSLKESEVLGLLLARVNKVVTRDVLIAEIWGYETRSLDVYIKRLRRKLGPAGAQIETVAGLGYRFAEPASGDQATPRRLPVADQPVTKT